MLATALQMEGHVVDEAATAADGLKCLEQSRYDLVLSDYAMPGGTGTWMLHQASQQGLLNHTIALIVTAHPGVRDLENVVEVITKPLDLDRFLEQVRHILATESRQEDPWEASSNQSRTNVVHRGSDHEQHPYRLYIEPGDLRTEKLTPEEAEEAEAMKRRRRR
jgi:DNA-binding NtrC family response regulator